MSEEYTTQMEAARHGVITEEMKVASEKEHISAEELRAMVADGTAVIPANHAHKSLDPVAIGSKLSTKIFSKKNKAKNPLETSKLGKTEKLRSKFGMKHLKILLAVIAVALIILLIITLFVSIASGKGKKLARKTAEYIGTTVAVAETKMDMHFSDKSAYAGLNRALEFNYVEESEDSVKVDGITYPEWAVLIVTDKIKHREIFFVLTCS